MSRKDFLSGVVAGFSVGVILMALIFMSTGCARGPSPDVVTSQSANFEQAVDSGELVLYGCAQHACAYSFQNPKTNQTCYLAVGSYPGFGATWRFDLECP